MIFFSWLIQIVMQFVDKSETEISRLCVWSKSHQKTAPIVGRLTGAFLFIIKKIVLLMQDYEPAYDFNGHS